MRQTTQRDEPVEHPEPCGKSRYDDFAALAAGRTLGEMCAPMAPGET
ncbi:MAG: hypothetical protein Q8Q59_04330 [Luteolibacter sp.]|nr:hypothetical protein [Luteolibacter sp.]